MTLPASIRIDTLLTGRAVDYSRPGSRSAIDKRPVADAVQVDINGIVGDEQGDLRVHGGPDKAIHHYPFDHYDAWRADIGAKIGTRAVLAQPGAFGENLSTTGVTEADICVGDRLCVGNVVLEVSLLRQPCWKLNDRFDTRDMARRVQHTGRTGWYYRGLEGGTARTPVAAMAAGARAGRALSQHAGSRRAGRHAGAAAHAVVAQARGGPPHAR